MQRIGVRPDVLQRIWRGGGWRGGGAEALGSAIMKAAPSSPLARNERPTSKRRLEGFQSHIRHAWLKNVRSTHHPTLSPYWQALQRCYYSGSKCSSSSILNETHKGLRSLKGVAGPQKGLRSLSRGCEASQGIEEPRKGLWSLKRGCRASPCPY
jgi:hypothetical protein